jgi:hypothetical protein
VRLPGPEVGDDDLVERVAPLGGHEVVGEELDPLEHHVGAVRTNLCPVLVRRIAYRGRDEAEVAALVVDADIQLVAVVVDVVLALGHTRRDQLPFAGRVVGREDADLARRQAAGLPDDELSAPCAADVDAEALVLLLVQELVVG